MFEKIELNNALIHMKKAIRKAKIIVINKIVKKIKSSTTNSEKHPDNHKFKIQIRKLNDQLDFIKKSTALQLAIECLVIEKSPQHILTNGVSKVDDVIVAHLSLCKGIVDMKESIKKKLHFDEVIEWQEIIRQFGKRQSEKSTLKKKKTKRKTTKVKKDQTETKPKVLNKDTEWLVENIDSDLNTTTTTTATTVESTFEPTTNVVNKKTEKKQKNDVKRKMDNNKNSMDIEAPPKKSIDSFFLTNSGENYLATAVPERVHLNNPDDGLDRKTRRAQNFSRPLSNHNNKRNGQVNTAVINKEPGDRFERPKTKQIVSTIIPKEVINVDNNKLHPSWAAKQKQKPVISQFKGTKITFDDDN